MPINVLSITKTVLFASVLCAQDMMLEVRVLNEIGSKMKLPMVLYANYKGANNLCISWSSGGGTRDNEVEQYFMIELKEESINHVV